MLRFFVGMKNIYFLLMQLNYSIYQVTEDAVNGKAPPVYRYAAPEAPTEDMASDDNDENSNNGPRAAVAGE